jgi:phosphatidylserine/phosphatidylglycerophosphate/cardiolipin synthase-like enzyme
VKDRAHYEVVVMGAIARAKVSVWISTANVKGLRVEADGARRGARRTYVSVLELFAGLVARGVELRLLHAGVPSSAFRADLARLPALQGHAKKGTQDWQQGAFAMRRCPRVHLKMIAVDGQHLYLGSANFTGAGLGAKGDHRRNFEAGVLTEDDLLLDEMQATFDRIWTGRECARCALRDVCPAPLDTLLAAGEGRS